jgi:thioredoxin-like negative regulator of GroEL
MAIDPGVPQLDPTELDDRIDGEDPVVVFFYADWCGFCRAFAPEFATRAETLEHDAVAANISDQTDPRWKRFSIDTVPTLIAFLEGQPVARVDGRPGVGLEAEDVDRLVADIPA